MFAGGEDQTAVPCNVAEHGMRVSSDRWLCEAPVAKFRLASCEMWFPISLLLQKGTMIRPRIRRPAFPDHEDPFADLSLHGTRQTLRCEVESSPCSSEHLRFPGPGFTTRITARGSVRPSSKRSRASHARPGPVHCGRYHGRGGRPLQKLRFFSWACLPR